MEEVEEVHIFIVEEEFLHLDSQDDFLLGDNELSNATTEDEDPGKEEYAQG